LVNEANTRLTTAQQIHFMMMAYTLKVSRNTKNGDLKIKKNEYYHAKKEKQVKCGFKKG